MATYFLRLFKAGSDGLAWVLGAGAAGFWFDAGVGCAACVGKIYTWSVEGATSSGLFVAWVVAVGFHYVGNGFETSSWGSSIISFPLPSLVIKGRISSWFSLGKTTSHIYEDSDNPLDNSIKSSISSWCGCC